MVANITLDRSALIQMLVLSLQGIFGGMIKEVLYDYRFTIGKLSYVADCVLVIENPLGKITKIVIEAKKSTRILDLKKPMDMLQILMKEDPSIYAVLAVPFCGKKLADKCVEMGLGVWGKFGYIRIIFDFVRIIEKSEEKNLYVNENKMRYETKSGKKLIDVLLRTKNNDPWTIRPLAKEAGLSTYSTHYIVIELEKDGFIKKLDKGFIVQNIDRLREIFSSMSQEEE